MHVPLYDQLSSLVPSQVIKNTRGALKKIMAILVNMTTPLPCETELFERGFLKIFLLLFKALCFVNLETF